MMSGRPYDPILPRYRRPLVPDPSQVPFCAVIGFSPTSMPWPHRSPPENAARSSPAPSIVLSCPAHLPSLPTAVP